MHGRNEYLTGRAQKGRHGTPLQMRRPNDLLGADALSKVRGKLVDRGDCLAQVLC